MKLFISLLFIIISIIGIADASYLTYEKIVGTEIVCGEGFDCGKVLNSPWSMIGPIPLSFFGLLFYLSVFAISVIHFLSIDITPILSKVTKKLGLSKPASINFIQPMEIVILLSIFGFLFSIYLISIMAFVIKAWCLFCLISALSSTLLFIVAMSYALFVNNNNFIFLKSIFYSIADLGYKYILKPIFFLFNPTTVHNTMISLGSILGSHKITKRISSTLFSFNHKLLSNNYAGIHFPNSIGLSAGFDYNGDITDISSDVGFGFHTIGTVTLYPYDGNAHPQLVRLPKSKSILVNKGLKNIGAKKIIEKLEKKHFSIPVGISIASTNKNYPTIQKQIADIVSCFILFEKSKVNHSYYELNISCPNTFGGEPFTTKERLTLLINALKKLNLQRPVFVKMPIHLTNPETKIILRILDKSFVRGVIFGNLSKDKNSQLIEKSEKSVVQKYQGNLSGKPTFERSNELITLTKKLYKDRFVIIGTGGIFTPEDAALKLQLGADLVQLITGMIFTGPQLIGKINHYLYRIKLTNKY